jgi:hypothetical chaperone protein
LRRIEQMVDVALARAGMVSQQVDHVVLTGGSSLIPAIRKLFEQRFGESWLAQGNELTSIAECLAMLAVDPELPSWVVTEEQE